MAQINKSSDYFNTVLYTGNGSTQSIDGVGFQPDWVWTKSRSNAYDHKLYDSVRGANLRLLSNSTGAETTQTEDLKSFDTDGFTLGNDGGINGSGITFASWNWLAGGTASSNTDGSITSQVSANTTSGFSIVSYTGTGSNATIGHSLGVAPKVVLVKNRDGVDVWVMQHGSLADNEFLEFNGTAGKQTDSARFNGTAPTSTVFSVGTSGTTNGNTEKFIAYCFAEKKGFSKAFSYTGNGSTDGSFTYLGFRPAWILIKRTDSTADWLLHDNKRIGYNPENYYFQANLSDSEGSATPRIDFLSNGFKLKTTSTAYNASGGSYIGIAFAENPIVGSNGVPSCAR